MRKIILFTVVASLVLCMASTAAVAKNHKVKLHSDTVVAGTVIEPGSYLVKLSDDGKLGFYKGSKLLAESIVTMEPMENETPNSVSVDVDGNLKEIRFKDEKAVFTKHSNAGQTTE